MTADDLREMSDDRLLAELNDLDGLCASIPNWDILASRLYKDRADMFREEAARRGLLPGVAS